MPVIFHTRLYEASIVQVLLKSKPSIPQWYDGVHASSRQWRFIALELGCTSYHNSAGPAVRGFFIFIAFITGFVSHARLPRRGAWGIKRDLCIYKFSVCRHALAQRGFSRRLILA